MDAGPAFRVTARWLVAKKKPTYTGVFLDDSSKRALLAWFEKETGQPILKKVFAHHMTIKFKPSDEEVEQLPIGEPATLRVIGWAADEQGQAVLVQPSVPSSNKHPHITVATDGTSPVYSNKLLAKGFTKVNGPTLKGTVGAFPD